VNGSTAMATSGALHSNKTPDVRANQPHDVWGQVARCCHKKTAWPRRQGCGIHQAGQRQRIRKSLASAGIQRRCRLNNVRTVRSRLKNGTFHLANGPFRPQQQHRDR
jgi:hypothetical protein